MSEAEDFAVVFNDHHRDAVRLAYLLCGDHHRAEDIVADAFARVYRRWRRGGIDDIAAYLRTAVINQTRSSLRRRYRERRESGRRSGDARGVRRVDEHAADRDEVWRALQRVPLRQRQAIVLRYYEDLPVAEAAEVLGVRPGTVKSQVSRGLDRLAQLLGAGRGTASPPPDPAQGGVAG